MEFTNNLEVHAPVDFVYEAMTDLQLLRQQLPKSFDFYQETTYDRMQEGAIWLLRASRNGRDFHFVTDITEVIPNSLVKFESESQRLTSKGMVEFISLSDEHTLVKSIIKLSAKGLLGRILLQTMRAARGRVQPAIDRGAIHMAEYIEDLYDQSGTIPNYNQMV